MNRITKRQMKKDLNLINDIYNIINKYFSKLLTMFNELTDIRHQSYVSYDMKTICATRLLGLICSFCSMSKMIESLIMKRLLLLLINFVVITINFFPIGKLFKMFL